MTRILIEAVSPEKMRLEAYREEGCGDWFWDAEGNLHIQVACKTDVWDDEAAFLVAFHELTEAFLCFKSGVTQGAVDAFDSSFKGDDQPGDANDAPYRNQHRMAMLIEHQLALFLGKYDYGRIE